VTEMQSGRVSLRRSSKRSASRLALLAGTCLLASAVAAGPARATPSTLLATSDATGGALGPGATDVTMTPDGRYVAFVTTAGLNPQDLDTVADVYVRDRRTNTFTRASVPQGDDSAVDGASSHPSISADGRYVAFESLADNLVPRDLNGGADVFVRDLVAGTTRLVSVRTDGTLAGPGGSSSDAMLPVISADGSTVAFQAPDFAIVSGGDNSEHVFAHSLAQPGAERVDTTPAGGRPNQSNSSPPSISGDGRYVAYGSAATDILGPGQDTNSHADAFVRDRRAATTVRASVSSSGGEGLGGDAVDPAMSADGTAVAFEDGAPNLVANDTNGVPDVFVRDLAHGITIRGSVNGNGQQLQTYASRNPQLSADARYVAFTTAAPVLTTDTNGTDDIYVVDRETGAIQRASLAQGENQALGSAGIAKVVGPTGRYILFETDQEFVAQDNNSRTDGYLRDSGDNTPPVALPQVTVTGGLAIQVDGTTSSDPDGWIDQSSWSFGDGGTATGPRGPHVYAGAGRYTVVLTVTDNNGATSTASTIVTVSTPGGGGTPGGGPTGGTPPGTLVIAPRNLRRPAIKGAARPGKQLRCSAGLWEGSPLLAFAWLRDGRAVRRAVGRNYRVRGADAGHRLACRVTATVTGLPPVRATSRVVHVPKRRSKP
jgi:Tol biopolymer transport system component